MLHVYVTPRTDNKILMIKIVRVTTGRGLIESKQFVESCWYRETGDPVRPWELTGQPVRMAIQESMLPEVWRNLPEILSMFHVSLHPPIVRTVTL